MSEVWRYSLREAFAWLALANERRQTDRAELLYLHAHAAQGTKEAINGILRELRDQE